jgi:apolipoprotein N-acyltransferase
MDVYRKNILLAFGEYLPFADLYPPIYRYIPQVSNFEHGVTQNVFQLADGLRIGVTICYEAIVPSFFRKVASHDVRLIVNLTNDSWFGPTVEPYQHAALAAFRSIETRIPLLRVTNTGTSFTVDSVGHMSVQTPVYEEAILHGRVKIPTVAPRTVYLLWGDWFVALCAMGLALLVARCLRGRGAPVSR